MKYLLLLLSINGLGAIERRNQDIKLPTQKVVEVLSFSNVVSGGAAGDVYVSAAISGPTSAAATTVSTGFTNPDYPRNLLLTNSNTVSETGSCTITVSGKDAHGDSISEAFAFTASTSASATGNYAFKEVSSVAFPANCEVANYNVHWKIGVGNKLGIPHCLDNAGDVFHTLLGGAKEATGPTIAADVDEVEKNTVTFNGTLNGVNDFVMYYMQNFRCLP